jgi:hypothetical protein|tara:strand:- start:1307 stop:1651 length:345 start_codon:yes stop_codon:yes gene_type:complete
MIPRSIQRFLKSFVLAMVVAGLALVPLWQSVGHASEIEHSAVVGALTDAYPDQDHPDANKSGHHIATDHAHEVPIMRFVGLSHAALTSDRWGFPAPLNGDGMGPYDPEQPPRHI